MTRSGHKDQGAEVIDGVTALPTELVCNTRNNCLAHFQIRDKNTFYVPVVPFLHICVVV